MMAVTRLKATPIFRLKPAVLTHFQGGGGGGLSSFRIKFPNNIIWEAIYMTPDSEAQWRKLLANQW